MPTKTLSEPYPPADHNAIDRELVALVQPDGTIELEWSDASAQVQEATRKLEHRILQRFLEQRTRWMLELAFCDMRTPLSPSLHFCRDVAATLAVKLRHLEDIEERRDDLPLALSELELQRFATEVPPMAGAEYVNRDMIQELWRSLTRAFMQELKDYRGSVESFIQSFNQQVHLAGRVYFHLVENRQGAHPFAFLATYSTRVANGKSRHVPLKFALTEFANQNERLLDLLATVYAAAGKSQLVNDLISSGELFHPLAWDAETAYRFLQEIPIYEEASILCRIPNWWKAKNSAVSLNISLGDKKPSQVGLDAIVAATPALLLDGLPISAAEIARLLQESDGLAFIKNRWVPVDAEKLKQTLQAYEQAQELMAEGLSLGEALRMQLNPAAILGEDMTATDITCGEWLQGVREKLQDPQKLEAALPGPEFKACLRPYQQLGVNWLFFLYRLKFGACLADDMGLGKTVQVLAFLELLRRHTPGSSTLLIVPASLLGNWLAEAQKFFPTLRIFGAHASLHKNGKPPKLSAAALKDWDVVLTTYSLVDRGEWFQDIQWTTIILDEAQAIKNPATRKSKAIKRLNAQFRLALTGTPIENRLGDLWSLFHFLNPGLLGNAAEFTRFTRKLKDHPEGYANLRMVVMPYILRRLKTDKTIIGDLPDKVEMKTFAELSRKQVVLYNQLIRELVNTLQSLSGIQRRGLVLASLMKCKQLCNHPDQYLGQNSWLPTESGKFQRLREICETVREKRERMLVFTQFREMTQPLHDYLEELFGRPGVILHGGVPVGKRKTLVESFQGRDYVPFMVLSIKAGGVGLNLTKANHVVHFDRWWNPAVENQATDRAFRIGQQKDVLVHKFVTRGTIEERIDQMIAGKEELATQVVAASGETWLTEMDDNTLKEMFSFSINETPEI